jgi:hypothetical protein
MLGGAILFSESNPEPFANRIETRAPTAGLDFVYSTAAIAVLSVSVIPSGGAEVELYNQTVFYSTASGIFVPHAAARNITIGPSASYQVKLTMETLDPGIAADHCPSSGTVHKDVGERCPEGEALVPIVAAIEANFRGVVYNVFKGAEAGTVFDAAEAGVTSPLGFGAKINDLTTTGPGSISVVVGAQAPDLGYSGIPGNVAFQVSGPGDWSGFSLTLPFDPGNLSAGQRRMLRVTNVAGEHPGIISGATFNDSEKTITFTPGSFGRFLISAPVYPNPVETNVGAITILHDESTPVGITAADTSQPALQSMIVAQRSAGQESFSSFFQLPHGLIFDPPAVVSITVPPETLSAQNAPAARQSIIEFSPETGRTLQLNTVQEGFPPRAEAFLYETASVFGAFAPPAAGVVVRDGAAPVTALILDGQAGAAAVASPTYLTTATLVGLSAVDPIVGLDLASGVATTYFLLDRTYVSLSSTPPAGFNHPFSLSLGSHTLTYFSADLAGNVESPNRTSFFVTLASSDTRAPRTTLVIAPPPAASSGTVYVNGASVFTLLAADDSQTLNDGLGVGATQTFYAIDGSTYARYASTFTIGVEGAHDLSFFSVDQAGNVEAPSQRALFADLTPPVTLLSQNGAVITLTATDPAGGGGGSGVARIRYLVDFDNPAVCDHVAEDTGAPRGTCENPWYAGPFTLNNGLHIISFQAFDGAGNAEVLQFANPNVDTGGGSGPSPGGMGIGKDPFDAFWTVVSGDGIGFAHANSSGALISSSTLQDAASVGLPWSVFFDAAGRAYAVGMAAGPSTQALDLAVYKANPAGDAVESRVIFDSGYGNNDIVFDVKAPGWIVGAAQTSGPSDFKAEGDRSLSMAVWKFDPSLGTVQLSTASARASFDLGAGVAVDADGSLWIVGYSMRPDPPAVGGFDLALWHYASDGRTLLGGPFLKPGYLSGTNGGIAAKVCVTTAAVYAAATRINGSGGTDMAFVKFDKSTGQAGVEAVWRSADGDSSYPAAILPEASGLLIAGGVGNDFADAALWRFGYDGSFLGATTADAGGARGAVLRGTQIWLSVDGSTVPFRVATEIAAPGALVDISTPSESAATPTVLTPSTGPIGVPFTITGAGFGIYGGGATLVKFGATIVPLSVWNDAQISGSVPGLSTGAYAVTIERQNASSVTVAGAGTFTVTALSSAALSVSAGPIGVPFSFTGAGFGPYAGALTRVLVDGATAPLSLWNDSTISGTIPGVTPGNKTLVIQRATGDGGLSVSAGFAFQVTAPSVTAVSPSSGPIGAAFSLTGQSFGPYAGSLTQVLIGGATTALSLWNDAAIAGTVPGALAPGVYPVVVERRTSGGGLARSNTVYFEVLGLGLSALSPSSGPIGVPFTISGTGFGAYAGANTRVKFGSALAALSLWNDATISGTVPALDTGAWTVSVERQEGAAVSASMVATFTVTALSVSAISPSSGPIGTAFTLTGPGFGPYAGGATVVLVDGTTAALSVWNDATITGTVPGGIPNGTKAVVVRRTSGEGVESSGSVPFELTGMTLASLSPASGPIGAPFTITGTQFGAYAGANTRVRFGGALAALSLWNDTTISGTVPNLSTGSVTVVVERQQGSDVAMSNLSSFTVVGLSPTGVSPSSGPIGTAFTITGSGFGPYAGANTRALIDGVAAALSTWNDGTVAGTIPGALAPGVHPIWLERSADGGVQSSATGYFTITSPALASLTPSSAPIGAPFTITGTSFGAYAGALTRVKIGGVLAPLSVWNDTTISGSVPGALSPGVFDLVVERAADAGLASSATQAFTVLVPWISTVSPSFGPTGTVVTLTGAGFGPYGGGTTKVLVGGATVPLSVWNDTTINWTVPAYFADGQYPVVVVREPAGGSVQSASATYTVGSGYGGSSFGLAAIQTLASQPDSHFQGDMSFSSATGGRIDTPAKAAVEVPPNAMDGDKEITLKRAHSDGLRVHAAEEIKKRAAGEPIEFGPEGAHFATPVTIELPYDPALTADEASLAIHYFNPLRRAWEELPTEVDRVRHVLKAKTDHFSIYQPMGLAPTSIAQDEFYFRDAYVFPNPSRGGAFITFRIQPGLAETVEVRVYDLAGRKLHDSSDFTFLGAVDDGNGKGAQDTYDHVWSVGGVGSGVYTYVIKASRGGQKPIVKSGKVGVIK